MKKFTIRKIEGGEILSIKIDGETAIKCLRINNTADGVKSRVFFTLFCERKWDKKEASEISYAIGARCAAKFKMVMKDPFFMNYKKEW